MSLINEVSKAMTHQEIFDTVVTALRKQGERSSVDDDFQNCLYRHPKGLKCAVGHLIKDEFYTSDIEGLSVTNDAVVEVLKKSGVDTDKATLKLLDKLQYVHDSYVGDREEGFSNIAEEFQLNFTSLPDEQE